MPAPNNTPQLPIAIFAVVVLYRLVPLESPSVVSLLAAASAATEHGVRLHIRIADNTPGGQEVGILLDDLEYRAYPDNPGLAQPYNDALADATAAGFGWLLTLDQDTQLPQNFLSSMALEAQRYAAEPAVAAIVPHIVDGERPVSPMRYRGGFLPTVLAKGLHGLAPVHASAINSGSLLKCDALQRIGGYDLHFPLHNSDTRMYQLLDQAGYRVAVADVTVPHELSILAREQRIRPERYRQMLEDECAFWDRHMSAAGRLERLVRLAGRLLRGYVHREDPSYRDVTRSELSRRLVTSRQSRLTQPSIK